MMYVFNRDSMELDSWYRILSGMKETLLDVRLGIFGEEELANFCKKAILDAQTNDKFEETLFWGFDEPHNMPSDARCEFFYQPTYLMTLTLANAVLQFPTLLEIDRMRDTLRKAFRGCTGRGLHGHGYDSTAELHSNLRLFLKSNVLEFLAAYPDLGEEFSRMLGEIMTGMKEAYDNGHYISDWNHDFQQEMEEVMTLYQICKDKRIDR